MSNNFEEQNNDNTALLNKINMQTTSLKVDLESVWCSILNDREMRIKNTKNIAILERDFIRLSMAFLVLCLLLCALDFNR